jgi:hypothetical protein
MRLANFSLPARDRLDGCVRLRTVGDRDETIVVEVDSDHMTSQLEVSRFNAMRVLALLCFALDVSIPRELEDFDL